MVELGDITRFSCFKKLNSFVGFKPTTYSSGEHDWKGHLTIRKHNALRSSLIECAWQTIQKDPAMLVKYEQLIKQNDQEKSCCGDREEITIQDISCAQISGAL